MVLDAIVLAVVVGSIVWGYFRGGLRSLLALVALLVAYVGSGPLAPVAAKLFAAVTGWAAGASRLAGRAVAGLCIYIPLIIVAGIVDRKVGRTKEGRVRPWNRVLGAFCGLASGLLLFFILVFLADVGVKVFPEASGWTVGSARRSAFRRWLSPHNPADRYLVTDVLRLFRAGQEDPEILQKLAEKEEIRRLLENPDFKRLVEDQELAAALRDGRIEAVLANESLRRVLADKKLQAQILTEMRGALREVLEEKGTKTPSSEHN